MESSEQPAQGAPPPRTVSDYPVTFGVGYPDRKLNRVTTAFRLFIAIPILILIGAIAGFSGTYDGWELLSPIVVSGSGLLFFAPLIMIVFRDKYPRWWFDWNRELLRFGNRVWIYLSLMDDRYPSTDEEQSVHLDFPYPDARVDLDRGLPLVKWLLAVPHYFVLLFLYLGAIGAVIIAWFAILFTGRYPRGLFEFVEGVMRWHNRVLGYAYILVTDKYPPFRLAP